MTTGKPVKPTLTTQHVIWDGYDTPTLKEFQHVVRRGYTKLQPTDNTVSAVIHYKPTATGREDLRRAFLPSASRMDPVMLTAPLRQLLREVDQLIGQGDLDFIRISLVQATGDRAQSAQPLTATT